MLHHELDEATLARVNALVDNLVQLTDSGLVRIRQGYTVEHIYQVHDSEERLHKLKVHVTRDSYDNQSRYYVDRWDGTQWQRVVSILGDARPDMPSPYGRDDADMLTGAETLIAELLHAAAAVILP